MLSPKASEKPSIEIGPSIKEIIRLFQETLPKKPPLNSNRRIRRLGMNAMLLNAV
jgi:hypothetical protein